MCGAFIGITSFSRVLSYALSKLHNITISMLTGFMLGSLNKVWPWKETYQIVSHGQTVLMEHNVMPNQTIAAAIGLMIFGFVVVYVLEKISMKVSK